MADTQHAEGFAETDVSGASGTKRDGIRNQKPLLFEVAWEVARKVGGIYTVLKSKSPCTVADWADRYCLIGPYDRKSAEKEFEPLPPGPLLANAIANLEREKGMKLYFGRWLIPGYPRILLIDINSQWGRINDMKRELWEKFRLPTPEGDGDPLTNEVVLFGFQVLWFLQEFCAQNPTRTMIAHFHEWNAACALPLCRVYRVPVATIFTTHATMVGRYVCAGESDFYNMLPHMDVDKVAGDKGIYHKHSIEKLAAQHSHVFTTVSEITGLEARYILDRKPDVILPNGLQVEKFTALHEFQNLHKKNKDVISEFVRGHFYGYNDFDFNHTLYFFTAGRYEYFNKGYNMFIEAMARLNHLLKQDPSNPLTVVAFIITPAETISYNVETLKGQSLMRETRRLVSKINENMNTRLFESISRGELPDTTKLISAQELVLLKQRVLTLARDELPPITTHTMVHDASDPILQQLRKCELFNKPEDKCKIVFHPAFLSATSAILSLEYEEFVRGCNLGIFCSYYEPWGYTPAECTVMGVPSVSSNLTGFAGYVEKHIKNPAEKGLFIVDRRFKSPEESMNQLVQVLYQFCQLSQRQRIMMRNATEKMSDVFDWKSLSAHYEHARGEALKRFFADRAAATTTPTTTEGKALS